MRRILAAIFLALVALSGPAAAKVIAILFDTSGSMAPRHKLPTFGAQLLAATVDGRAGRDRLLTMSFNEYLAFSNNTVVLPNAEVIRRFGAQFPNAIRSPGLATQGSHQAALDALPSAFRAIQNQGTPYGPIEIMLDRLAAEIGEGEEAFFVVVSDGAYSETELDGRRRDSALRGAFEAVRGRIRGALRVEYLFIDGDPTGEFLAKIESQGVVDALLTTFNGPASAGGRPPGFWRVSSEAELWEALKDIIARVSATDRQAQRDFVAYSGDVVSVESPLSIGRIVTVSTAPASGRSPEQTGDNFGVAPTETRRLTARMTGGDSALNASARAGVVTHQWFQNAIAPGSYQIQFSGPVGRDVLLLFETQAITDLVIRDESGAEPQRDVSGRAELVVGRSYVFESRILDGDGGARPVDFASLPAGLSMTLTLSGQGGPDTGSMDLDLAASLGRKTWRPEAAGEHTARSRASIPGFLSPASPTLAIVVIDSKATITVSPIEGSDACQGCAPGEIVSRLEPGAAEAQVGAFDITVEAMRDGAISLDGSRLPDHLELRDPGGAVIGLTAPIPFAAGETRRFEIWRKPDLGGDALDSDGDIAIRAAPAGPWNGAAAEAQADVRLEAPDIAMRLVHVTQPVTQGALDGLVVPAGELVRGAFLAQYSLENLFAPPDREGSDVSVSLEGAFSPLVGFAKGGSDASATGVHAIEIRPRTSYWCLCFLGVANRLSGVESWRAEIRYEDRFGRVASSPLLLVFPIGGFAMAGSCALDALIALLIAMAIRGVIALFMTHRFPPGAVVEITEGSNRLRYFRLDKRNSYWWKAWLALFRGNPDESRVVEGLRMTATRNGAVVNLAKSTPPWRIESVGESFGEIKETRPRIESWPLRWGEVLEHTDEPTLSMKLKRRSTD